MTHGILAKCERHVFTIAANLDINGTKLTEDLSNGLLERIFVLGLKKTLEQSALGTHANGE